MNTFPIIRDGELILIQQDKAGTLSIEDNTPEVPKFEPKKKVEHTLNTEFSLLKKIAPLVIVLCFQLPSFAGEFPTPHRVDSWRQDLRQSELARLRNTVGIELARGESATPKHILLGQYEPDEQYRPFDTCVLLEVQSELEDAGWRSDVRDGCIDDIGLRQVEIFIWPDPEFKNVRGKLLKEGK